MTEYHILYIGENAEKADIILQHLHDVQTFSSEIITVTSFDRAATTLAESPFDLILIDIDNQKDIAIEFVKFIIENQLNCSVFAICSEIDNREEFENFLDENHFDGYWNVTTLNSEWIEQTLKCIIARKETEFYIGSLNSKVNALFSIIENRLLVENTANDGAYLNLCDNLKAWHQLHNGIYEIKMHVVYLDELIAKFVKKYSKIAAFKNIEIISSVRSQIIVKSDAKIIEKVLSNLMDNAIKFSNENSHIFIDCQIGLDSTIISVKDKGCGMTNEQVQNISENVLIVNADNSIHVGIGLQVCIELIQQIGGEFWLESELGKGSEFYFAIP